ncbi:MAG: hypothetical protein CSA39_04690 [Flavobacteriales bacterium]|nr:MAG: hypothetical protein CSA39_04690 [Flavobacteriales bacterium]
MNFIDNMNYATGKIVSESEKYAKLTTEYVKLKAFQQVSYSSSFLIKIVIIGSFAFMATLFLLLAATFAIGNALGSLALGALIVGVVLLLIVLLIYALRKKIDKHVIKLLSNNFFD